MPDNVYAPPTAPIGEQPRVASDPFAHDTYLLKQKLIAGVEAYERAYVEYFDRCKEPGDQLRDPAPRVILIPGIGMINTGKDVTNADVSRQLYHRAIAVIGAGIALVLVGGLWSGLAVGAAGIVVPRLIKRGARRFVRIAIAAGAATLTPPCGACRQVLWDLCGDIEVILLNLEGKRETLRLSTLLPRAFDATYLD